MVSLKMEIKNKNIRRMPLSTSTTPEFTPTTTSNKNIKQTQETKISK